MAAVDPDRRWTARVRIEPAITVGAPGAGIEPTRGEIRTLQQAADRVHNRFLENLELLIVRQEPSSFQWPEVLELVTDAVHHADDYPDRVQVIADDYPVRVQVIAEVCVRVSEVEGLAEQLEQYRHDSLAGDRDFAEMAMDGMHTLVARFVAAALRDRGLAAYVEGAPVKPPMGPTA